MVDNTPQSRNEAILQSIIDSTTYTDPPQSRIEDLLLQVKDAIEAGGGGGGTTNYEHLSNLPQVNGTELKGNMRLGLSVSSGKVSFYEEVE